MAQKWQGTSNEPSCIVVAGILTGITAALLTPTCKTIQNKECFTNNQGGQAYLLFPVPCYDTRY
jgi:hypothetical protein